MTTPETQKDIELIDREIFELTAKRFKLTAQKDSQMTKSESAVNARKYEREFLSHIEAHDINMENCQKVLFRTLFNLSRSYSTSQIGHKSHLSEDIAAALRNTPSIFPQNALVACQGVEGAYSQIACDKLFSNANIMFFRTFDGVFQAVESGLCQYGVLPIENSSHGSVNAVYDLMKSHKFHIVRSKKLQISHKLLAKAGTSLDNVREVYSHEQAIGQCSRFFKEHREIKATIVANTAIAAQMVADSDRDDVACISSPDCTDLYNLQVLSDSILNSDHNYTRFICISKNLEIYPGADRASIMLALGHKPGTLSDTLAKISAMGFNLTKIESRPITGKDFEFMFYLDIDASVYSDAFVNLLCQLDQDPDAFTYLGSYSEV